MHLACYRVNKLLGLLQPLRHFVQIEVGVNPLVTGVSHAEHLVVELSEFPWDTAWLDPPAIEQRLNAGML